MNNAAASFPEEGFRQREVNSPEQLESRLGVVVLVAITSLLTTGSPRVSGENPEHTRTLAGMQDALPPIIVHRPSMRVLDGLHRLRVAVLRGEEHIGARFFDGTEADAFVLAVRANITHGLPLSITDRRAAAARILASHQHWSDRMVASVSGLSAKTVADVRRTALAGTTGVNARVGRDGRVRPVDRAERRLLARRLMLDESGLSLRQVARIAGISPETARTVRAELKSEVTPRTPAPRGSEQRPATASTLDGGTAPFVESRESVSADYSAVVRDLRFDPSLRFTDSGRALLRLLGAHAMDSRQWAIMAEHVPAHCRQTVAQVAMDCADIWRTFSQHLARNTAEPLPRRSHRPDSAACGEPASTVLASLCARRGAEPSINLDRER